MEKQDAFTQALLRAMDAAEQEAGVPPAAAAPGPWSSTAAFPPCRSSAAAGRSRTASTGLAELGRLALSAEALAVSAKFNACFTDDEVNHCFAQLCAANYFGKARF